MNRVLELLVELRFWVAAMITALSAAAAIGLGLTPAPPAVALVFFSALGVYNLDHVVDRQPGLGRWPLALAALSALGILAMLALARPALRWLVGLGLVAICLYFVPFRIRGRSVRLENLPGFKPVLIGGAVSIAAVTVPWLSTLAHGRARPYPISAGLALVVVLASLCASNALLFDISHAAADRDAGVPTAPSVRGELFTRRLATFGLSCSLLGSACGALWGLGPLRLWFGTAGCAVCLLAAAWLLPARTPRALHALLVDGALAVPWLFVAWG